MPKAITPLTVSGIVVHGDKVGRTLGFPTANLTLSNPLNIETGVYAGTTKTAHDEGLRQSLIYYGPRLIFGEQQVSFEVYLYDFTGDLYGQPLAVTLTHFIRPPQPFTTLPALQLQMEQDKAVGLACLNTPPSN